MHGITREMVEQEPRFAERRPDILAFAQGLPFVAHNASFDIGVLRDASGVSGLDCPEVRHACTLQTYRGLGQTLDH
jgi:DNA polymerase-3 subunit epsilon